MKTSQWLNNWKIVDSKLLIPRPEKIDKSASMKTILPTVSGSVIWKLELPELSDVENAIRQSMLREHIIRAMGKNKSIITTSVKNAADAIKFATKNNMPVDLILALKGLPVTGDNEFTMDQPTQVKILSESREAEDTVAATLDRVGVKYLREEAVKLKHPGKGTPDFVFNSPVRLTEGNFINWLEVKNYFGGFYRMERAVEQTNRYEREYGPGMIVYLDGYSPEDTKKHKCAVVGPVVAL
jgi:hypothetical protein